jgi:hypothetical protein
MSCMMAIYKTNESKWHGSALLGVFGILFLELRWSEVWQNRWAGFVLGFMFAAALCFQVLEPESLSELEQIPRGVFLLGGIALFLMGAGMMIRFAQRGTGDDALTAWILSASGSYGAYVFHRLAAGKDKHA